MSTSTKDQLYHTTIRKFSQRFNKLPEYGMIVQVSGNYFMIEDIESNFLLSPDFRKVFVRKLEWYEIVGLNKKRGKHEKFSRYS